MASAQSLVPLFLLIFLSAISTNHSHSLHNIHSAGSSFPIKSEKVKLVLYYETLCPSCRDFITKELVKVFTTDLNTIVDLKLVPYGNARVVGDNRTIICQHDEDECYLNSIHACAINIWPKTETHFNFVYCGEKEYEKEKTLTVDSSSKAEATWKHCARKLHMEIKSIQDCYDSGIAKKLMLRNAKETRNLRPPHTFVPWVTVNSRPLGEGYDDFVAEVCKAYKGENLPKACRSSPVSNSAEMKETHHDCYDGNASKTRS